MSTIVTRAGKGSPLTNTELDSNFSNLNTDKAELSGSTFTGNLSLGDNVKLQLGNQTNGDLQLYHDGNHSWIKDAGAGNIYISSDGYAVNIVKGENTAAVASFIPDGPVNLYNAGDLRLATTSTGIDVTGSVTADGLTSELGSDAQGKFSGWSPTGSTSTVHGAIELGSNASYQGIISYDGSNNTRFLFDNAWSGTGSTFEFRTNTAATAKTHLKIEGTGDISFYDSSGSSQNLFWDSSTSRLGLGTTVPQGNLTISNAAGTNAPTSVTAANTYLQLGSDDYGSSNNGKFMIGLGYTDATNTNSPAYIGFEESSTSGDTKGDLTFYTRNVITDTAPTKRLTINADGSSVFSGSVTAPTLIAGAYGASGSAGDGFRINSTDLYGQTDSSDKIHLSAVSGNASFSGAVTSTGLTVDGDITVERNGVQTRGVKWNRNGTIDAAINLHADEIVKFDNFYNGRYQFRSGASGSEVLRLNIATGGDISFYEDTGSTPKFFWDASAEALGLGTTVPSASYSIDAVKGIRSSGAAPNFTLQETDTGNQTWLMASYGGVFSIRDTTVSGSSYPLRIDAATPTNTLHLNATGIDVTGIAKVSSHLQMSGNLDVVGQIGAYDNPNSSWGQMILRASDYVFKNAGSTAHLTLSSSGNVNIPNGGLMVGATTAPTSKLHVESSAVNLNTAIIKNTSGTGVNYGLEIVAGTNATDHALHVTSSSGASLLRVNGAGSVGIGTNSPDSKMHLYDGALHVQQTDGSDTWFGYGSSNDNYITTGTGGVTVFREVGSEKMRLSGGNLLVGTTSTSLYNDTSGGGINLFANGGVTLAKQATSVSDPVLLLNNTGTAGQMIDLRQDGTSVGIIGSDSNSQFMIGSGDTGLTFQSNTDAIIPRNTDGTARTQLINLGTSGAQFKDLYLSNKVYANYIGSSGDTNTNIYFPTGDQIRFITGGNERARIDSSGQVKIHTPITNDFFGLSLQYNNTDTADFKVNQATGQIKIGGSATGYYPTFWSNNTERTRIASNGTLYHGKTADSLNTGGLQTLISGQTSITQSYTEPLRLNRMSTEGAIQKFYYNGGEVGSIGADNASINIGSGNTGLLFYNTATAIYPRTAAGAQSNGAINLGGASDRFKDLYLSGKIYGSTLGIGDAGIQADQYSNAVKPFRPDITSGTSDNYLDLGTSSVRWVDIYATNGTIQTSDRNEKQDIEDLTEAEERVAVAAKGLLKKFRWKSAVEDKGDDARIHFGIIAQDLQDAFEAEGLDAGRYGMFTSNTWTNEDGEEQTRMGVRYSELLAFIISAI